MDFFEMTKTSQIKNIFRFLEDNNSDYYLTGSRAWEVHTSTSDYDIIYVYDKQFCLKKFLVREGYKLTESNYNQGFIISTIIEEINFIPLSISDYKIWRDATISVSNLCRSSSVKERIKLKDSRIALFEIIKGVHRGLL